MAETNALLKRRTGNRTEGSNPSVSAKMAQRYSQPAWAGIFSDIQHAPILRPEERVMKTGGDPARPALEYAAGRAILDPRDPTRVLERADVPFFAPELALEKTGQYEQGTTFIEGLVYYGGRWLIYYGSADSVVGVAAFPSLSF